MYYAIIILSVIMFGGCFALKDVYRAKRGSGIKISLQFSLTSSIAALFAMAIISGLKFEFTPFTLIMAVLSSLNGFAFTFFSFKALDKKNKWKQITCGYEISYLCNIWHYEESQKRKNAQ